MNKRAVITANEDQQTAIDGILKFLTATHVADTFCVLSGPAGSGKTFCVERIKAAYQQTNGKLAYTAPTNKAAKVLRALTGEARTIYSLLGLRLSANGEMKELSVSEKEVDLSEYDAVVIDEAGMINTQLFNILRNISATHGIRFLLLGDEYQLPPVGEKASPIWRCKQRFNLTKVVRHDNQILELVTAIRLAMDSPIMNIMIKDNHTPTEGIWKINKADFQRQMFADAQSGMFADTNKTKVIVWRNSTAEKYNNIIRQGIFGSGASYFEVGERIIAAAPCITGKEVMLPTDDEAVVESVVTGRHPLAPEYETIELKCRTEDNRVIRLTVLHPNSRQDYENKLMHMAHAAKTDGKQWKGFWAAKELFHDIKYAYCITAHRAQGSTYETVYVDYQDILVNRERREAFQCLYVACSRPTTRLKLA